MADQDEQDPPVTVLVARKVADSHRDEFEHVMSAIVRNAMRFPGHLGANVFRPVPPSDEYRILFKFCSMSQLENWRKAPATQDGLKMADALTEGEAKTSLQTGLETWFTLPQSTAMIPPARWKMAAITWGALFPLVTLLQLGLEPIKGHLPFLAMTLLVTGLVTLLMTWVVMPRMVRLLGPWLRKRPPVPEAISIEAPPT